MPAAAENIPLGGNAANDTTRAPSKFSESLRSFADQRTGKALGVNQAIYKKMGRTAEAAEQKFGEIARTVRGVTLDNGTPVFSALQSHAELTANVRQAFDEANGRLSSLREKADAILDQHPEHAPDAQAIADKIQSEVVAPILDHPSVAEHGRAKQFEDWLTSIRNQGEGENRITELTKIRQSMDDQIYQLKNSARFGQLGAKPQMQDLEKAKWILEDAITAATDKASTYMPKAEQAGYKELKTQVHRLGVARDIAGDAELREAGNNLVRPGDYLAGIGGAAMHGGPAGVATAIAHHVVRDHANAIAAVLADKLANTLDGKIESGLGTFFRESAARAQAGLGKAASGLPTASAVPIRRIATAASVDAFMGKHASLSDAYQKRVDQIVNASQDNGAGARKSVIAAFGGAGDSLPRLTAAATITATRGVNYLQSQIPSGTFAPTVFQPTRSVMPSELQMREFAQKWGAVANPISVVDDLRRGTVTHAQVDAIKNVYPELYQQIQTTALEMIRKHDIAGKPLAFSDRNALDLFLSLNGAGEPTLAAQFVDHVVSLQEQAAQGQAQGKPAPGGGTNTGKPIALGDARKSDVQATLGQS